MKEYPISQIPRESWIALYFLFRRQGHEWFGPYDACDGVEPSSVETTKLGIVIRARVSLVPDCDAYQSWILLARPRFSAMQDFTESKLESARIRRFELDLEGLLSIEIA